jgi:hypothetical protein
MKDRLATPEGDLQLVMDQSIYVRKGIESLVEEGALGTILCSMVILLPHRGQVVIASSCITPDWGGRMWVYNHIRPRPRHQIP